MDRWRDMLRYDMDKRKSSSKYIIVGIDKESNVTAFNNRGEKLTGFTRNEVLHRKIWDVLIPKDYADKLKNHLKNVSTEVFKMPIVSKEGKNLSLAWRILPIQGSKDNDLCLIGVEEEKELQSSTRKREDTSSTSSYTPRLGPKEVFKSLEETSRYLLRERELLDEQWKKLREYAGNLERLRKILYREKRVILREKKNLKEKKRKFNEEYRERIRKLDREIAKRRFKIDLLRRKERTVDELNQKIEDMNITITRLSAELNAKGKENTKEMEKLRKDLEDALNREKNLVKRIEHLEIKLNEEREINKRLQEELMEKERTAGGKEEKFHPSTVAADIGYEYENLSEESSEVPFFSPMDEDMEVADITKLSREINAPALILKKGVIQASTPTFADMVGYARGELKNKNFFAFVSPEKLMEIRSYYLDRLKGKDVNEYETILLTKEKEPIPVKIKSNTINWKGERAELLIIEKID